MEGKVLITGATGFIGTRLCTALAEKGCEPIALSRNPDSAKKKLPDVKTIERWDPLKEIPPLQAIEQSKAVVHLAGENVAGRWNEEKKRLIRESRVVSTKNLVDALKKAAKRPEVLISASAIGYYGDRGDEILTEDSSPGEGFLSDICRDWEREAARAEELGIRVVSIRIGIVLGTDGGALKEMLFPFRLGVGGPLATGKQWMAWIHRDDLVGIILHVLQNSSVRGAINGTAPFPVQNSEFSKTLGRVLHRPAVFKVPSLALKLLFGEFAAFLLQSERVVPRVVKDSGYIFQYETLSAALKECLGK